MALHTRRRLPSAIDPARIVAFTALLLGTGAAGAGCSGSADDKAQAAQGWASSGVNTVSRPVAGAGVAAVTGLRPDGSLETSVFDLAGGRRLWSRPATMAGRLSGMGVGPPAVTGGPGSGLVTAVEPRRTGRWNATLVARDARTGAERWVRPVDSTFGPVRCGPAVCLSEFTARENARFAALDPATGRSLWKMPGVAEVEHVDESKIVLFRMAERPSVEARDLRTGRRLWSFPIGRAIGHGVDLSGGWAFGAARDPQGAASDVLVGYLAPYQARKGAPMSPYGFFGLRMSDGKPLWSRKRLLRVYPTANPGVFLFTRQVTSRGGFGAFERLDPRTGRTVASLAPDKAPKSLWWLSFPADLSKIGFVMQGRPGTAFELRDGTRVTDRALRTWSFCALNPPELKITGHRGFYAIASLCAYEVATGRKAASPGPPPAWYTGTSDGWRVWRDERGAVHGVRDGRGSAPGMYGT